ncbi:MAG: CDP-diacylglycerol--glycerol-3-phosphate 3-phosphatidyltransferase [Candidatus Shapirobacteria bacterium]|nr:CDP-diacylglycerol--glycerol-3-phosphate 3-phosphatidyltransferase [Candidatus Shapirobacteria bacterium]
MNIPNILTVSRMVLIPIFLTFAILGNQSKNTDWYYGVALIFAISGITDFLDGYIARAKNQITKLGKILDPIADKLTMVTALLVANCIGVLNISVTIIIVFFEVIIVIGNYLITHTHAKKLAISSRLLGKLKTSFQFIGFIFLFLGSANSKLWFLPQAPWFTPIITGQCLIYLSIVLTILAMVDYTRANINLIRDFFKKF